MTTSRFDESDATRLIQLLWQQQELIEYLLENRVAKIDELPIDYIQVIDELEMKLLKLALEQTGKNYKRSAELLKLNRTTFMSKIQRFNLHERKNK